MKLAFSPFGATGRGAPPFTRGPSASAAEMSQGLATASAGNAKVKAAREAKVTRKDFTDRLGLPADASDEQVFAAIDKMRSEPKPAAPRPALSTSASATLDALAEMAGWPVDSSQPTPAAKEPTAAELDALAKVAGW